MARITYGAIVTSINGSIGGTTFQNNAYGKTIKAKPNMVRPQSTAQNLSKRNLVIAQSRWRSLSDTNRAAWVTWASTNPQYSANAPTVQLSAYAVYIRQQLLLLQVSPTQTTDNPNATVFPVDSATWSLTLSGSVLTLNTTWLSNDGELAVPMYMSRPLQPTQNFIGTKPRFILYNDNTDYSGDIASLYTALFGVLPVLGDRIALKYRQFQGDNGSAYPVEQIILTVTAP